MRLKQVAVGCAALALWVAIPHPGPADAVEDQAVGAPSAERDPFAASDRMRDEAEGEDDGPQFLPSKNYETVPVLRLKAFIEDRQEAPIALIEVQGHGTYLVRAGDAISLQFGGRNVVLQVEEITNLSVLVQVGTLGQVIVVR